MLRIAIRNTRTALVLVNPRVGEFILTTLVIPVCLPRYGFGPGAGHAVKLSRYPESDQLNALDPCLRRDDD